MAYHAPMSDTLRALVLRTAGTNCDAELVRAFALAGCTVDLVHVDRLAGDPSPIDRADFIGFPGGFSYGDDIASGRILAARVRETLWPSLRAAADRGVPMIGVCNGFQVMVQLGLLPGPADGAALARRAHHAHRRARGERGRVVHRPMGGRRDRGRSGRRRLHLDPGAHRARR
jgi:phosphoribosylformylglycinamidine (FGAM) synthase-like amidotransferase family enzyme